MQHAVETSQPYIPFQPDLYHRRPGARLPNREPGDHPARAGRTARPGTGRVPGQGAVGAVAEGVNVLMSTLNVLIQRLDEHI